MCYEEALEKGHGRIEQRKYEVFKALPILEKCQKEWPSIEEVIKVTRYRQEARKLKPTLTVHYYVSNRALNVEKYAQFIRQHWWIENKVNHVKDVAFLEDRTTKQCNPYAYSTCIDFILNIMNIIQSHNIKNSLFKNSMSINNVYEKIKKLL
jgi:predicted transposase YbfD/YdcC